MYLSKVGMASVHPPDVHGGDVASLDHTGGTLTTLTPETLHTFVMGRILGLCVSEYWEPGTTMTVRITGTGNIH